MGGAGVKSLLKWAVANTPAMNTITVGVIVNSLFKAVLALVLGSPRYRLMTMLALIAQAAAAGGGFWLLGWLATK